MTIVNEDSRVINKLETPLTDDARVIIYDHHMFVVPANAAFITKKIFSLITEQAILIRRSTVLSFLHQ
jgi:hypothetical protein